MGTGLRIYSNGKAMVLFTVLLDGTCTDIHGVEIDPIDPETLVYSRRAIDQAISESGFRTRTDLVVRTHGSSLDVRMSKPDFVKGRNALRSVATMLTRAGHEDVILAMQARYAEFLQEELAA